MGACKSKEDSSTLSLSSKDLRDIQTKITTKLKNQTNETNVNIISFQNISFKDLSSGSHLHRKEVECRKGPFGIIKRGKRPLYGCSSDITQIADIKVQSFKENLLEEDEKIWADIKTTLEAKAKHMNTSAGSSVDTAIAGASEYVKENIRNKLENISQKDYSNQQTIEIELEHPQRCLDPCGWKGNEGEGPKIDQSYIIDHYSYDILQSSLKIVEEKLADHEISVEQVFDNSGGNDACLMQLIIICIASFVCILVTWKVISMVTNKGGGGGDMPMRMPTRR